jgi:hypothetical protein
MPDAVDLRTALAPYVTTPEQKAVFQKVLRKYAEAEGK